MAGLKINIVCSFHSSQSKVKTFYVTVQWAGIDFIMHGPYSKCSSLHETDPITFIEFLETKITKTIAITPDLILHPQWWLNPANISKGRSVQLEQTGLTITTDASMPGNAGYLNDQIVQGNWDKTKRMLHSNCLKMEAAF